MIERLQCHRNGVVGEACDQGEFGRGWEIAGFWAMMFYLKHELQAFAVIPGKHISRTEVAAGIAQFSAGFKFVQKFFEDSANHLFGPANRGNLGHRHRLHFFSQFGVFYRKNMFMKDEGVNKDPAGNEFPEIVGMFQA